MMWFDGGGIRGKLESCMRNMVCLSGGFFVWMEEESWGKAGETYLFFVCLVFFADFI